MDIVFLGTGGGRFVTYSQRRWTGGIRFINANVNIHLDPGPGAIVRSIDARLSPEKVKLLLISHSHPDHYNDAEIFIEGMTSGTTRRRGTLIAPRSVLFGNTETEQAVSKHHQSLVRNLFEAHPGDSFDAEGISVYVTKAAHTDPDTVGYLLDFGGKGKVGYTSDTEFFDGIGDFYRELTVLILCVMRPIGAPLRGHLSTNDAEKIVASTRPKMAVLTHFGMKMLNSNPSAQAGHVQRSTGVPTTAAYDGMILSVDAKGISAMNLKKRLSQIKDESR